MTNYMVHNRAVNGAANPDATAKAEASAQAAAEQLDPNTALDGRPHDLRFTPDLSTPEAINRGHYMGGLATGIYNKSYEDKIYSPGEAIPARAETYRLQDAP